MNGSLDRPPIANQPVSVIIPVAAGEDARPLAIQLAPQVRSHKHEILVAPFGSAAAGTSGADVEVLPSETCHGAALAAGIKAAQHPLVFVWPARWGACAVDFTKFLALIDQVDIVAGYRPGRSWWTRCREGWPAHLWFGLGVTDVLCPVRLYRRSILERIPIQSQGTFADVEILAKANFLEALMVEVELPKTVAITKDATWSADARRVLFRPEFLPGISGDGVAAQPG